MLNIASERWGISQQELIWEIPFSSLLYRYEAFRRNLPVSPDDDERVEDLPDVASMGFSGLDVF